MAKPKLDIKQIEKKWQTYWEKEKTYKFNPNNKRIYSIDTPPPYISGSMHIGHAFSYSQEDFIARYKRMKGFSVFHPFGTDDNGLPTERFVEKTKNVKSKDMSRTEFMKLCIKVIKESTPELIQDWKKLAISCDYDIYYSTIDNHAQKISQGSFIELFKKGLIYREKFPTIFCPECQTPIAQAELEDKTKSTFFTTVKFKAQRKDLPIATTRPELLPACVAVFINPKDERYKNLIGKKATVPLFNYEVPILADPSADIEKGTGILMVCSYGDKYDVDAVNRFKLEPRIIFNENGTLNMEKYKGMKIQEARKQLLHDLKEKDLIIEQKEIEHVVNSHDKCGTEIEFLPVEQWFIKLLDKKEQLVRQGKKINWFPKFMFKRYENWVRGLSWDWSISRDRYFGVPIPAWICEKCNEIILPKESELPVDPVQKSKNCPKCSKKAQPETKVLDTWATSSLTPQIAAKLTKNISLPFDLRPQAHDIIRTWTFYTITKALLHENKIPWKDIAISGFATLEGKKMGRSRGVVVSPQKAMEEFGADALRYWAASSKLGEDMNYYEKDLVTGKKFVTKLLNATNFVFMNLKHQAKAPKLIETDRLFLTQLNKLVDSSTKAFDEYNYSKSKIETDAFFWKTFADNYLEIVKGRVYNGTKEEKDSAFYTLYHSLLTILKLMAPITPFITEELYQKHFKKTEKQSSIHLEDWPTEIKVKEAKDDAKTWNKLIEIIAKVRQAKSENKKSMNSPINLTLSKEDSQLLKLVLADLKAVTASEEINEGNFRAEFV